MKREKTPLSESRSQACLDYAGRVGVPERKDGGRLTMRMKNLTFFKDFDIRK